jgi:hypothetical protein
MMNSTQHQFIFDANGKKTFAVIPIEDYEALFLHSELDAESKLWLDGDMGEDLPEYDWGTEEIPPVKPIKYQPGVGFIVVGGKGGG